MSEIPKPTADDMAYDLAAAYLVVNRPGWLTAIRRALAAEAKNARTYCAYCGHEEPVDGDGSLIACHIRSCEKHPMRAVEAERDKLAAFKAWTHSWLDAHGVPHDPDPEHTAQHGCCISGRMQFLLARAEKAERNLEALLRLNPAQVDELLERWDLTAPDIQRATVAAFAGRVVTAEAERDRLRAALEEIADGTNHLPPIDVARAALEQKESDHV